MSNRRTHTEAWWERNTNPAIVRCVARYKTTGEQCRSEVHTAGSTVCWKHGGKARQVVNATARKMQETSDTARQVLLDLLQDSSVPPGDRIRAAVAHLDRAGVVPENKLNIELDVKVDTVEQLFLTILGDPDALADPTVPELPPGRDGGDIFDELNRKALLDDDEADDVVDAELVEEPTEDRRTPTLAPVVMESGKTPERTRKAMERELRKAGLW